MVMEQVYAYLTEDQQDILKRIQKEIKIRQEEHVSLSKLVRYGVNLLSEQNIEDIITGLRRIE